MRKEDQHPRSPRRPLALAAFAAAAALLVAAPLAAQDSSGCVVGPDGTLECSTIEIHGALRNIVMISFTREPLGIRLLELRQSFVQDILDSVREAPF